MKKRNKKNILIYFSTVLVLLTLHNKSKQYKPEVSHEMEGSYELYTSYRNGNVYFCDSISTAKKVSEISNESDVIVVDQSDYNDPNMKILSSYKIKDKDEMKEILEIIKEYCDNKGTSWNRSIKAMQNEWIVHNICSSLAIKRSSTDDVDLNNSDEKIYKSEIVSKILGN